MKLSKLYYSNHFFSIVTKNPKLVNFPLNFDVRKLFKSSKWWNLKRGDKVFVKSDKGYKPINRNLRIIGFDIHNNIYLKVGKSYIVGFRNDCWLTIYKNFKRLNNK